MGALGDKLKNSFVLLCFTHMLELVMNVALFTFFVELPRVGAGHIVFLREFFRLTFPVPLL